MEGRRLGAGEKTNLRVLAVLMAVLAIVIGIFVPRAALSFEDGGPPLGAIVCALPAFGLLITAGAIWNRTLEKR